LFAMVIINYLPYSLASLCLRFTFHFFTLPSLCKTEIDGKSDNSPHTVLCVMKAFINVIDDEGFLLQKQRGKALFYMS